MDKITATLREGWRRISYVISRYGADRCSENAAALTYMSLFALVPLLTVLYTMASAIPAFQGAEEQMQAILFERLIPETSADIKVYVNDFSQQAKNLTGPGIAFLLVTAVLMLRNVEMAFNQIWRVHEHRGAFSSFMLYWAILTLTPITIGLALGLSTYLSSVGNALETLDFIGAKGFLLQIAPLLLSTTGFSLVYAAVPNCRVPFRHALVGGFLAAGAFHIARRAFTDLVVGSSITFIYGAFAAVPLFLLWIYLSWNIVLMGGILVHSLSAYQNMEQAHRPMVLKALDVLHLFWQKQKSGTVVRELELLNNRNAITRGLDSESWGRLRDILLAHKVITESSKGHYLLSRDLHTISFWQLKEWVNSERVLSEHDPGTGQRWQQTAYRLLREQRMGQRELLKIDLATLFSECGC